MVLECPIEGNAIYVLAGNWKRLVNYTKGEIREGFSNQYHKVVHKGEWLSRIRQALWGNSKEKQMVGARRTDEAQPFRVQSHPKAPKASATCLSDSVSPE